MDHRDWGLTPAQSIGATLAILLVIVLVAVVGTLADNAFQRYMLVTMWRAPRAPFAWVATVWRSTVDGAIRLVGAAVAMVKR